MAVIEVRDLRKRYGDTVALDGIDLEVRAGEVFGLLGPNGAGKTTAVEIIEGLRRADSGTVRVLGLDPRDPELREQLFLALALVGHPELVFFDEITTGLDPAARRQAWELVRRVRAQGVTVVLVSHLMDEAEELCDRVAILDRGRIVALDTPTALIDRSGSPQRLRFRPAGPLPAGLVGNVPGVLAVERSGSQVLVTGTGDFATGVTAALASDRVLVADLRLEQRTLDDAFLALTGRPMDDEPEVAVPADRRTTKKLEAAG